MSLSVKIDADATKALTELDKFEGQIDATVKSFEKLGSVTIKYNKSAVQTSAIVRGQLSEFESVTQKINKAGEVVSSVYQKNEAAARKAEEAATKRAAALAARQARDDGADAVRAARAAARYEREVRRRNELIDKEIEANARKAAKAALAEVKAEKAADSKAARDTARFDRETKKRNDAIDKELANAAKQKKRLEDELNKPPPGGNALTDFFGRIGRNLVQFASFKAFHIITDGIVQGVKAAKDFQIQLSLIRTISQDNQQSFAKFGRDVRGVSDSSGIDIKDVGKAFYDTTSNQIAKGADVAPFVKQATDLARVTGSELPDSVNLLSSAINAYGLSAADAERISALFFKTIDEGRIVTSEMANTFGRVAVLGSNLGVPIEDLNAILAITTQKGLKTSDAMTLLTNLLIKLEKPTEATAGFFSSLGVETGEQAIAMYGLIPLVNKMVEAVKAGRIDVSAFFDEIRGRKQFGIFEQSGGEIQKFSDDAKNLTKVTRDYKAALEIRGESPADALNKEINKLSNVFKVDLGQAIVKSLADLVSWVGGVDNASKTVKDMSGYIQGAGVVIIGYTAISAAATLGNYLFATSTKMVGLVAVTTTSRIKTLTLAMAGALRVLAPLAAGYYIGKRLFGGPGEAQDVKAEDVSATLEGIEKIRVAWAKYKAEAQGVAFDPLSSFKESSKQVEQAYKSVLQLLSQASIINGRFLDVAKEKSKETADALKVGFGTYTDIFKKNVTEITKRIHDANEEIKRSTKSVLKFNESLDEIVFRRKEEYANDDFGQQKIRLGEQRLADLYAKKDRLLKEGTEESIAEARAIYDVIAQQEDKLFGLKIDHQKKQFQNYLDNNPQATNNIFAVDVTPLEQKLAALAAQRAKDEERIVLAKEEAIKTDKKALGTAKANEDKLNIAIKNYEKLDLLTKDGKLNPDFKDKDGKFDRGKLNAAFDKVETAIRAPGGATFEQRIALEQLLFQKKLALIAEADAFERQEDLKTAKTQILTQKERSEKEIEDLKQNRAKSIKIQTDVLTSIGKKSFELAGFEEAIKAQSNGREEDRNKVFNKRILRDEDIKALDAAKDKYQAAAADAINNPMVREGIAITDPRKAKAAYDAYADALKTYDEIARKYRIVGGLPSFQVEGGQKVGPDAAKAVFRDELETLRKASGDLYSGVDAEKENKESFKKNVLEPVEKLKSAFPDLKVGAQDFSDSANQSFKNLANGGVEQLREKLEAIKKLMPVAPVAPGIDKPAAGATGMLGGGDGSGYAYAATGGTVGMFPGQPRGQDVYPIWAAKGERIIDAKTSSMYAPMLDAIMQRRMPQYMAGGGMVGGDTHVGDINITVNGARTNSDTARTIGQHLERQLRLNNIRLEKKR